MSGRGLQLTEDGPRGTSSDHKGYSVQILPSSHAKSLAHRRFNHPLTFYYPPPPQKNPPLSAASLPVRSRQLVTAPLQRRPQLLTPGPSRRRTQDGAQGNRQPDTLHACTFLFGHGYWRNGGIAGFLFFLAVFGS